MANPEQLRILRQGVQVWNRWRKENSKVIPDLSGANLQKAILEGIDLSRANLNAVDLTDAKLGGADLRDSNLHNACMFLTDLLNADLRHAKLSGVDFADCNLRGVKLAGANLSDARMAYAALIDVDLSEVEGLETVKHERPATIDLDTLYGSKGKIPDNFLRGAGVPEDVIRHLLPLIRSGSPIQFYSCFISYSHHDNVFACSLHEHLERQGIYCWLDEHELLPGDDLHEGIDRGIRLWDKVLLCASKASLTSWWVDGEINRAFLKEAEIMKERGRKVLALIPLNLDGFLLNTDYQSAKKAEIQSRLAANFVGWEDDQALFDRELQKVVRALRTDDGGRDKPPEAKL